MDDIDKKMLFHTLDSIISIPEYEDNTENALYEIIQQLKKLSRYVEDAS
jgi:hypothetical protein